MLRRSSTNAAKKTMDSGVAGRSMMAVVCSTSVGGGEGGGGRRLRSGGYCWLAARLEMKVSISARPAVSRLLRSGLVLPRRRW